MYRIFIKVHLFYLSINLLKNNAKLHIIYYICLQEFKKYLEIYLYINN